MQKLEFCNICVHEKKNASLNFHVYWDTLLLGELLKRSSTSISRGSNNSSVEPGLGRPYSEGGPCSAPGSPRQIYFYILRPNLTLLIACLIDSFSLNIPKQIPTYESFPIKWPVRFQISSLLIGCSEVFILEFKLILKLRKRGDQALIPISTILKFSALNLYKRMSYRPLIFQIMNSARFISQSLKYQTITPLGCKDIRDKEIRVLGKCSVPLPNIKNHIQ